MWSNSDLVAVTEVVYTCQLDANQEKVDPLFSNQTSEQSIALSHR